MTILTRIKLFFKKLLEKTMPISNSTTLEELLHKQEKVLFDTKQKYYKSKAKEDYYNTEIKNNEKLLVDTMISAKKSKENDDNLKLKKLFEVKTLTESKIKTYQDCLEKQKEITNKLNSFVLNLERKVTKLKCDSELLKTKDEFVQSVTEFSNVQNNKNDINIDDVVKNINISFDSKSYELQDLDSEIILEDCSFDDFVKEL